MEIKISTWVEAPVERVWKCWVTPEDIIGWNSASPDWHSPRAENDLRPGGTFNYRMEAVDGSFGFDFNGIFTEVTPPTKLSYVLADGRKVEVVFEPEAGGTRVTEVFEAESTNPVEMQEAGWKAILENFEAYVGREA
jgi:uncharacterized protein YndB with AHSA1/START domain